MDDSHKIELHKFCRVCAKLLHRDRVTHRCEQHSDILAKTFGVLVTCDVPDIHPQLMCNSCYCALMRSKKAMENDKQYNHNIKVFPWIAHSPSQCSVCDHFENAHTGGRPKKQRRLGRPASSSTKTAVNHICSVAPPSFFLPDIHTSVALQSESVHIPCDLLCQLCSGLLDRPVLLTVCNKLVCMSCLCEHLEKTAELICPCCNSDHIKEFATIIHPPSLVMSILGNHQVTCTLCNKSIISGTFSQILSQYKVVTHQHVNVASFQCHILSKCTEGLLPVPSSSSVNEILSKSPEAPLTPIEQQLTTSLVRRQLSSGSGMLEVKTRGQVCTITPLPMQLTLT